MNTALIQKQYQLSAVAAVEIKSTENTVTREYFFPEKNSITIVDDLVIEQEFADKIQTLIFTIDTDAYLHYRFEIKTDSCKKISKKLVFRLIGERAEVDAQITFLGKKSDHVMLETIQQHQAARALSRCVIKTVLDQDAFFSCKSSIIVDKKAQGTVAQQLNKNILLSSTARVHSVPQLEIEAHDVSCKHGAAISKFSDEHFFYLQSRGISRVAARELLITAFLQ